jgi:cytoskeletal protein CcmA (bactofilin family)
MPNTALMPVPMIQFFTEDGLPLSLGKIYSYQAGTTTPLATYTDSDGSAANTNPIILDAGGFANIWLLGQAYKIVAHDSDDVLVWTQDNVSAVSQTQLAEIDTLATLHITGNLQVDGDATVDGTITAASGEISGELAVDGNLTAATAAVTGNASVGGTLGVTGATTLTGNVSAAGDVAVTGDETIGGDLTVTGTANLSTNVNIGADTLAAFIAAAITVLSGELVVSDVTPSGNFVVATFGGAAGTKVKFAFGFGAGAANASSISLPGGFSTSQLLAGAWVDNVTATPGNQMSHFAASITAGVITVTSGDNSGHNFTPTSGWAAVAWLTGQ